MFFYREENPCEKRSLLRARLYLISLNPLDVRGYNSEKRGIRARTDERSPAGIDEAVFSNVTRAENGRGCGLGRGGYQEGVFPEGPPCPTDIQALVAISLMSLKDNQIDWKNL